MSDEALVVIERVACPSAGACGGQFTAVKERAIRRGRGHRHSGTRVQPSTVPFARGDNSGRLELRRRCGELIPGSRKFQVIVHKNVLVAEDKHSLGREWNRIHFSIGA